ncbi:cynT, partial [Symbiodinium pilosum]
MRGDLFVLRNAGNTCTHAEGSIVGSLEFCTGKLGAQLVLVLGHTQCGAVAGATKTYQAGESKALGSAFAGLLQGLAGVAQQASEGGYHLETGRVEFLGCSPQQADALAMLKDGNERFAVGAPTAGKVHQSMRADLNNMGQAPHTALVGCADSRVPLETVFDAFPGA